MPLTSSTVLIPAPRRLVAGLLRDTDAAREAMARAGHALHSSARLLVPGDVVTFDARLAALPFRHRTRIQAIGVDGMSTELAGGLARELRHRTVLREAGDSTSLHDEISWTSPFGLLGRLGDRVLVERALRAVLAARAAVFTERAAALGSGPIIVGTAIVRDGAVLAAQRARPAELRGRWEVPGGRVEEGETEQEAVARECREELGAEVVVGPRLGTDLPMPAGLLRVYTATLTPASSDPKPLEHLALRWLRGPEIETLNWIDTDRALLPDLLAATT